MKVTGGTTIKDNGIKEILVKFVSRFWIVQDSKKYWNRNYRCEIKILKEWSIKWWETNERECKQIFL